MKLNFTACPLCGAVIEVTVDGEPVYGDGAERHGQWHASLRGAVRQASSPIGVVYESQLDGI